MLLTLVGLAIAAEGVQKIYVFSTNRSPARMTCEQYLAMAPGAKWLELVDYLGAVRPESRVLKVDEGTYVPVRPAGKRGPARLLLKVSSEEAARHAKALLEAMANRDPLGIVPASERTPVETAQTVQGLVQFGMDSETKVERALESEIGSGSLSRD